MLNTILLFHLSQYSSTTAKDMLENLYVDNIITGCESDEAAVCYYHRKSNRETACCVFKNILLCYRTISKIVHDISLRPVTIIMHKQFHRVLYSTEEYSVKYTA